ncbi:glycosyltransferase 87 family protein [Falsarthrobacter nasiphocae]|uniref:Alpha-1,2-mannosyltransferase n=1 Tax=Falsarthrobacter nasiphocae TaxID=189863 RepID=A0AAE3YEN3_9MICC|nr:glycosyltransferase 87 family protein [Falsarthrobacter nasiphocae]MDR6892004.1 alpha-1,2-mannosyltransferase [Falsarthrobacter nasiphocae]
MTTPEAESRSAVRLPTWAGWCIGAVLLLAGLAVSTLHGTDLMAYRSGARAFLENPAGLYEGALPLEDGRSLPFTYPPFSALIMVPLALLPYHVAMAAMTTTSVVGLFLVCRDLAPRVAALVPASAQWVCTAPLLTGIAAWLGPIRDSFAFGQINIIVFSAVYLACVRWGLGAAAGVVVGIMGGIKLTPLALGLLPLVWGRWKMLVGMAAGFAGTIAAMMLVAPGVTRQYWFEVLRDPSRVGGIGYYDNISFEGVTARFGMDMKGLWFLGAVCLIALGLMALLGLRGRGDLPSQISLASAVMLFISPISWAHHAVWILVILYGCVVLPRETGRYKRSFAVLAVVIFLVLGVGLRVLGWDSADAGPITSQPWAKVVASIPALCLAAYVVLAFLTAVRLPDRPRLFELPQRVNWRPRRAAAAAPTAPLTDPTLPDPKPASATEAEEGAR